MSRSFFVAASLILAAATARADEAIAPDTVAMVKRATVFVRVQGTNWKSTGSGFVIVRNKDSVLIATNHHVISSPEDDKRPTPPPGEFAKSLKQASVTVVFDGGTKTEQSYKAEVLAADPNADLAVLRVTGLKEPPAPIDYTSPPKLTETMPVYTFGFPFGQALATGKGAPAITVGKGAISSLRLGDSGELSVVQIDGALNPGNSGGPVVDAKGRLVGVAVATIKNGQGIGFAVPAAELGQVMRGRLGGVHMTATRAGSGKLTVRAEVGVIDPSAALSGVALHYVVVAPKGKRPEEKEPLERHPGVKRLTLKVDGGVASGEISLDSAEGEIVVQAVPEGAKEAKGGTRPRSFALAMPKGPAGPIALKAPGEADDTAAVEIGAKPPAGWKEYTPKDRTYVVWVPEKVKSQGERERTSPLGRYRLRVNLLVVETIDGPTLVSEELVLPVALARQIKRADLEKAMRNSMFEEVGGKVVSEADVKLGPLAGKEYRIDTSNGRQLRVRIFVGLSRVFIVRAVGTQEQVASEQARIFLNSCRLPVGGPQPPGVLAGGPRIQGGGNDPEFSDKAPEGGVLIGFEVGIGRFGPNPVVKSARPIFRVGSQEALGEWHGPTAEPHVKETVKAVAKPGYAVGAITVKNGLGMDGLSITYMRIAGDRLDPKDAYESEWVGGKGGGGPVKISGDGKVAIGLIGKSRPDTLSGMGLLFKGDPVYRGPRIQGGGSFPEFKDEAPAGGLLVGFEFGTGKAFSTTVVKTVKPLYRVGDKDQAGAPHGATAGDLVGETVKVVAKPGYAVGAVTMKNLAEVDGLSVTFMKVKPDGKLDPKDAYESEWVGGKGGAGPVKLGGDGTPVIGLLGRSHPRALTGLGLIYKEDPTPAEKK